MNISFFPRYSSPSKHFRLRCILANSFLHRKAVCFSPTQLCFYMLQPMSCLFAHKDVLLLQTPHLCSFPVPYWRRSFLNRTIEPLLEVTYYQEECNKYLLVEIPVSISSYICSYSSAHSFYLCIYLANLESLMYTYPI